MGANGSLEEVNNIIYAVNLFLIRVLYLPQYSTLRQIQYSATFKMPNTDMKVHFTSPTQSKIKLN